MGSLTSVRKIWELCFCNVSQALQPDSIPEDLWALRSGEGDGWPLRSQSMRDTLTETLAGGRGSGPSLLFRRTLLISDVAGCCSLGRGVLFRRWTIWSHFILSLFISHKSFPHPTDPPKFQRIKMHRKAYTKAARWEEWCYKDKSSVITKEFSQPL